MIKYKFREYRKCDMCSKEGLQHIYLDDKKTMKQMCPEYDWGEQYICEGCAKREAGNRKWMEIKHKI